LAEYRVLISKYLTIQSSKHFTTKRRLFFFDIPAHLYSQVGQPAKEQFTEHFPRAKDENNSTVNRSSICISVLLTAH